MSKTMAKALIYLVYAHIRKQVCKINARLFAKTYHFIVCLILMQNFMQKCHDRPFCLRLRFNKDV